MIVLQREKPNNLILLESILRRLPMEDEEYEYYKNLYITTKHGFEGEIRVDREWGEIIVPSNHYLFHNYETENEVNHSHQIDTIFICRNFILLLEIKNIGGQIDFDQKKHQFIRTRLDGTRAGFSNPINQIERHVRFFKRMIWNWNIALPVEYAIILAQPTTIIGDVPSEIAIFHVSGLQTHIYHLFSKYNYNQISDQELECVKKKLLEMRKPKEWDVNVDRNKLRTGALCKRCLYKFVMEFKHGQFVCPVCKTKTKESLYEALLDYRNLHDVWISNSEFRNYLYIESRYAAKRLIIDLKLEYRGFRRDRQYKIPRNILAKFEKLP
ncbi:nuclease-related domain-containing protein [Ureibacillus endophyticus]|uniref:NERD domain-containing protein n=1 Tax=Ureibacillus endophyticus TaxID=1978490 RepID=A0A494YU01_9BACL|nr:nuclease-related domain-containing protein [Lysinibacillus endophyticus]RKQ13528.1 NERD domain-containing protein [Lysinibacillus endophyticus]